MPQGVDLDDARGLELGEHVELAFEHARALARVGARDQALECHAPPERAVACAKHLAHSAFGDRGFDLVAAGHDFRLGSGEALKKAPCQNPRKPSGIHLTGLAEQESFRICAKKAPEMGMTSVPVLGYSGLLYVCICFRRYVRTAL